MLCEGHHEVLHNCNEWRTGQRPGSNGWPQWLWLTTVVICFFVFSSSYPVFSLYFCWHFPPTLEKRQIFGGQCAGLEVSPQGPGASIWAFQVRKGERVCWFQVRRRARPSEIALVGGFKSLYIIDYYSMIVLKTQFGGPQRVWDNWVWGAAYKNQTWLAQNPLPACHVYSIYIYTYIRIYIYISCRCWSWKAFIAMYAMLNGLGPRVHISWYTQHWNRCSWIKPLKPAWISLVAVQSVQSSRFVAKTHLG